MDELDPHKNPEDLLDNVGNLDTARMTLRWALERIRGLEKTLGETQRLLKEVVASRDKAADAVEAQRKEGESRIKNLAEKERFVTDMQKLLNDLFKGDVQVADVVRQQASFENEKKALEEKVRKRLDELDLTRQKELAEHNEQLAEIEASYSGALAEAQKRYHAQVEDIRRLHEAELRGEKEKYDRFREEALSEGRIQEDQYHQKLLALERDFSQRRVGLQRELEAFKQQCVEEQREIWQAEKENLEKALEGRTEHINDLEGKLRSLEASFHEKRIEQAQAARKRLEDLQRELLKEKEVQLDGLRADHEKHIAQYIEELARTRAEIQEREKAHQAERTRLLQEQNRDREAAIAGLKKSLEEQEEAFKARRDALHDEHARLRKDEAAQHENAVETLRGAIRSSFNEERKREQEQAEQDLEALRRFYDGLVSREKQHAQQFAQNHEREVAALRDQFEERTKTTAAAHAHEMEVLRSRFEEHVQAHLTEHNKEVEAARDQKTADIKARAEMQAAEMRSQIADIQAKAEAKAAEMRAQMAEIQARAEAREADFKTKAEAKAAEIQAKAEMQAEDLKARAKAHTDERQSLHERIRALQEELKTQYAAAQAHQDGIEEEEQTRLAQTIQRYEERLKQLEAQRAKEAAHRAEELQANETRFREMIEANERRHHDQIQDLKEQHAKEAAHHAEELLANETRFREMIQANERRHQDQVQDLKAQRAKEAAHHAEELQANETRFREMIQAGEKRHQSQIQELEARLKRLGDLRDTDAEGYRGRRRELENAFETIAQEKEARVRQQDIQELDAVRQHFQRLFEARQRDYESQTKALNAENENLRAQLLRKDDEREHALAVQKEKLAPHWGAAIMGGAAFLGRPAVLAAALAVTGIAAAAFYWRSLPAGKDYSIPFSHTTALLWKGDTLWASDWLDQSLHRLRLTPKGLVADGRFPIPRSRIAGMTFVGDNIYIADAQNDEIQMWTLENDRLRMLKTWRSPGGSPSALHFDGEYLWSADMLDRRIFQHVVDDDLTVITSYPAGHAPVALYAEKEGFWTADSESRLIFRRRWDDALTRVTSYRLEELDNGKTRLSAFTFKDGRLWLARDGEGRLLERPLKSFHKAPFKAKNQAY